MKTVTLSRLHFHNLGKLCGTMTYYMRENCALLGYYAVSSGNFLPPFGITFRSHPPFGFLNPEDWTDTLSRNVGKKLPLLAA
jgi:hypothetical protein